jgi:predicted DNA-binding protein with PD1-like motif
MISIEAPGAVWPMMISFRRGNYIIEELQKLLKKEGVDAAFITSGIGSFDVCKLHTITVTDLPPEERYFTLG